MAYTSNAIVLTPFDGKSDFSIWQKKMKCILIQQKVFKAIDNSYASTETNDKKAEMNELALSAIILNLSDSVIRKVGSIETAHSVWNKLIELYVETSLPSKLFLLEKFFKFKLDMNKDIDENLDIFTKLIQDIKQTGDKHIDDYTAVVLLNAIPDSYNDVKSAIKYGRDNVTLDIVVNGLKSKELDLRQHGSSKGEVMHVRGRSKTRYQNKKHVENGQGSKGNGNKARSKSTTKTRKCFKCHEPGHMIKDCPQKNHDKQNNNEHANIVFGQENFGEVHMVTEPCVNSVHSIGMNRHEWLIDSGCSYHMSPFKELFTSFENIQHGFVSMANDKNCDVLGIGNITLSFSSGVAYTLKNVRYVSALCNNLMSCAALEDDGLEGKWAKGFMKILKGNLVIFKAEKRNNLYV
ncbi:hypothetical protein ACS0TY_002262 [Phlomoides rotata]